MDEAVLHPELNESARAVQQAEDLPRISVVTPSFNQAPYLEATIRSVLEQGYPNLEYIVIDGGSTDGSREIIERYADRLAYWVSEPDDGQADAINKGLSRATGEIFAYLNSDDVYLPGALQCVAEAYQEHPEADLFHGDCAVIDEQGRRIGTQHPSISTFGEIVDVWNVWWKERNFVQPEVFWTRRVAERVGPFDKNLFMVMDYEYWTRILRLGGNVIAVPVEVSAFRRTSTQKSNQSDRSAQEMLDVVRRLLWDAMTPIPWMTRARLQGCWLYSRQFLSQVQEAVESGQPRWKRMLGSLGLAIRFPKLLLVDSYRRRAMAAARTPREPDE